MRLRAATAQYLTSLDKAPATVRSRRWALADLAVFAAERTGHADPTCELALDPDLLTEWINQPQSVAASRAKAATARALSAFLTEHALLRAAPPAATLTLPAPTPAAVDLRGARHLLAAAAGDLPYGVPRHVWFRFSAHVHLLATTGIAEEALAQLRIADLSPQRDAITIAGATTYPLPDLTRHAVSAWLEVRTEAVNSLQGSDPHALWIRLHPGKDRRTGHIAPAGMPISARGLRLSFTTVRDELALENPTVAAVTVRDVRALGRLD